MLEVELSEVRMCQYDPRCKVRQHRSPEACPYRGRQPKPVRWNPSVPRPTPTGSSQLSKPLGSGQTSRAGGRYRQTAVANGITFVDLLVLLLVSKSWERFYSAIGWWGVALVVILVVLPFAVAGWLTRTCTAWNSVARGRCQRVRPKLLKRCEEPAHSHAHQFITLPEFGAAMCLLMGAAGVWALLAM